MTGRDLSQNELELGNSRRCVSATNHSLLCRRSNMIKKKYIHVYFTYTAFRNMDIKVELNIF